MDEEYPMISVIVTMYNRTQYVHEAIKSVVNQTLNRSLYEIIIVSNMPVDISEYGKNVKFRLIEEEQIGKMYSIGVELSKGDIITFLDDDDIYYETSIAFPNYTCNYLYSETIYKHGVSTNKASCCAESRGKSTSREDCQIWKI